MISLVASAATAHAARLEVRLPRDAALKVVDRSSSGPRIDCPPTCVYEVPGPGHGISQLKVEPEPDPRIGDRPWDILAMPGCEGTSALPADNAICTPPSRGNVTISFELRYRPIVAVTYGGSYGGPLSGANIQVNPAPGYQGSGGGYPCDITRPAASTPMKCAAHFTAGQPVALVAASTNQAALVAVSSPCGSQTCEVRPTEDTCIAYVYTNGQPDLFPTVEINGPECKTGPGISGGGGPTLDPLQEIKDRALQEMRRLLPVALGPCQSVATGLAVFGFGGPVVGTAVGGTMVALASPVCLLLLHDLIELQKIYNDPPDFDFDTIVPITPSARPAIDLPSCGEVTGADRRVCRRVGKAATKYLGKVQRVSDVIDALRITVERASAAAQAGKERASKRQLRAAAKRQKQLDAALTARGRFGSKLASALTDAGATGGFSEAQYTEAVAFVLAKLAEQGLAEAEARTVLGPALTPAALDLLAVLGEP